MHDHDEKPYIPDPDMKYQSDEVTLPQLGKAGIGLIIFFFVNLALASGAYYMFVVRETTQPKNTFSSTPKPVDPNVPILQKDPVADIRKFRADEYAVEHSYMHWQDGDNKKSLRIPIARAMEIVKANGLPKAKTVTDAKSAQTTNPPTMEGHPKPGSAGGMSVPTATPAAQGAGASSAGLSSAH